MTARWAGAQGDPAALQQLLPKAPTSQRTRAVHRAVHQAVRDMKMPQAVKKSIKKKGLTSKVLKLLAGKKATPGAQTSTGSPGDAAAATAATAEPAPLTAPAEPTPAAPASGLVNIAGHPVLNQVVVVNSFQAKRSQFGVQAEVVNVSYKEAEPGVHVASCMPEGLGMFQIPLDQVRLLS